MHPVFARSASARPVSAKAPGKVNISFHVGSLRKDGTRAVATLYQAVSIYDKVIAHPSDDFSLEQGGSLGFGRVPFVENNLAMRAARQLAAYANVTAGVRLEVFKGIPRGTGMSGGSADAAAALIACNELWGLRLDRAALQNIALELGADVSFSLEGGTAVGTGHGDEFSQALSVGSYHWVILPVGRRLDEDRVLRVLDDHRKQHEQILGAGEEAPRVSPEVLQAIRSGDPAMLAETLRNDLQAASFKLAPQLAEICEYGERNGALAGIMLAMGPGIAFLMPDAATAEELCLKLERGGQVALSALGPVPGARLSE